MATILVRGSGDIGSAIAYALFNTGYRVLLHDDPRPAHARRAMAFTVLPTNSTRYNYTQWCPLGMNSLTKERRRLRLSAGRFYLLRNFAGRLIDDELG